MSCKDSREMWMKQKDEPIRVAQIMGKLWAGGVEMVVFNYYRAIDKSKIQFDFYYDADSTVEPPQDLIDMGARFYKIPPYQKLPQYIRELKKHLKENQYLIVHSHLNTLSVFPLFVAWMCRVPVRVAHNHRLVRFNGFFPKPQSGTYLILDEGGYQVAGQKGTWLVSDEVEVDGQRFVQMRSEQTKNPPPSIILHESGAFVTQTALGFDGEATRKMRAFLQGPKPELLHHQKFFENGTAERAKESGTEQNYNMIDGCVNNVPKKPRRIGGRWSVLDRLHIKQAERRQKDNAPQQEQERSRKS